MRFSPKPIEDYFITALPSCSIRLMQQLDETDAYWNLMWLCNPKVDYLPGSGKNWHISYDSPEHLSAAIVTDLNADFALFDALNGSPKVFLNYWRNMNHSDYDVYKVGGDELVATVIQRAEEAMLRLMPKVEGNVITARFGRAA